METLKYIKLQQQQQQGQPIYGENIPFEIDAENVFISTPLEENSGIEGDSERKSSLQTAYTDLKRDYDSLKNDIVDRNEEQLRYVIKTSAMPGVLFTQEEKDKIDTLNDIRVIPVYSNSEKQEGKVYTPQITSLEQVLNKFQNLLLSPPIVQVKSFNEMLNIQRIYVYTGLNDSVHNLENGHWYYYSKEENSWEDGGIYSAVAIENKLDTNISTINSSIRGINSSITSINSSINTINENIVDINDDIVVAVANTTTSYDFKNRDGDTKFQIIKDVSDTNANDPEIAEAFAIKAKNWAIGEDNVSLDDASDTNNAKYYSGEAKKWTIGTTATGVPSDTNNAEYYSDEAKKWAIGTTASGTPSDTNNAKYWATQIENLLNISDNVDGWKKDLKIYILSYADIAKYWAIGTTNTENAVPSDINNAKYYSDEAKKWAVGTTGTEGLASDEHNAKAYAEKSQRFFNQMSNNCVTSFGGVNLKGDLLPSDVPYKTTEVIRQIGLNETRTIEQEFVSIQNNINSKVDKTTAQINLETVNNQSNIEDYNLYLAIQALGWDDVIV